MQVNSEALLALKNLIYNTLDPLLTGDYCLLDIPDHPNIGDQLILEGEYVFLSRFKHKELYSSNDKYENLSKIPKGSIILLHGGGNFGDLYPSHEKFRKKIIENFPQNRVIVFPQTVFYRKEENALKTAEVFNVHPDLTICARDSYSYDVLKKYFVNNNIVKIPDMALCLDLKNDISKKVTKRTLILKRKDKELPKSINLEDVKKLISPTQITHMKDWPTMDNTLPKFKFLSLINFINRRTSKQLNKSKSLRSLLDNRYGLLRVGLTKWYVREGIKFINKYDEIYTTRLHVYILSVLLDKKVHMIDNSYGKNSHFFNTWMKDFQNSDYLTGEDIEKLLD